VRTGAIGAEADAVERYFSSRYPGPARVAGIPLLRRGEDNRAALVRRWVPRWDGVSVLDAGCGDGAFLHRVLEGRPARLRLEDVSPAQLRRAAERLRGRADTVETRVADVSVGGGPGGFDVILALGVADYAADWRRLVRALLDRSAGMVIADFPRQGVPHHLLRRCWLALHGVRLSTASRAGMDAVLGDCSARVEVVRLPLHWMVRLEPGVPG
jgi:SAM-dependent methyltransferase